MTTTKKSSTPTRRTTHKHVYVNDVCACGTLTRAAQVRKNRDEVDAVMARMFPNPEVDMVISDLEHSDDPMVSVTEHYTIFHHFQEEERGPVVSEMIANNAYEAIANAMTLVKPYSGEMFTATWFDCNGTKREVSVKVLDRK